MKISPIWVICALNDDEFSKLEKKLERQFDTISANEIEKYNKDVHKWWKITNLSTNNNIEDFVEQGHPKDVPAINVAPTASFGLYKFTVVYYAKANDFTKLFQIGKSLQSIHDNGKFMNGAQIIPYGLCVVSAGEDLPKALKDGMKQFCEEEKPPMNKILFQGDQNKNTGNRLGYDSLMDTNTGYPQRHIHDLSVQIITHLALVKDNVSDIQLGDRLLTAGVFSLVFEKESEKLRHAIKISELLFKRFCTEKDDERWHNDDDAVMTTDIKQIRDWNTVYADLISGFKDEELKNIYPNSSDISPWTLVSKYMIPLYFNKYIRSFIKILYKNVHDHFTKAYISFGIALDNGFSKLIKAHAPENEIKEELLTVWNEDNVDGALGIEQCKLLLNKIKTFYEEQKQAINNMQKGDAPNKKNMNFPHPQDFPIKSLGIYREYFENYWSKKKPADKRTISADSYGNNLLKKLSKVLKYHPIPLSLLARSILTALFLPFAVYIVLRLIPDVVLNTTIVEEGIGKWILSGGIFVLCILWGLFKYSKLVLGKIKSLASDYIGWYIYKTQKLMFDDALKKADDYYKRCIWVCDEYAKNLESFVNAEFDSDIKQIEGYEQTMFQCDITGSFDNWDEKKKGPRIIKEGTIIPKAILTYKEVSHKKQTAKTICYNKESDMEQLYVDLTRSIINMDSEKTILTLLGNGLFPIIPYIKDHELQEKKDSNDEKWEKLKQIIFKTIQSKIRASVELYVGNRIANNIADIAFTEIGRMTDREAGHFNFNGPVASELRDEPQDIYTNTLITSRLMPSVQNKTASETSFISLVHPKHDDHDMRKWKKCFLNPFIADGSIKETTDYLGLCHILYVIPIKSVEDLTLKN